MTTDTGARPAQGVRPIELLWDLVFVFAVTQVTAFLEHDHGWAGAARGMLLLALMWWAWSAFVWVVNAHSDETQGVRISLMGCIVVCFITALALPDAFTTHGVLFAVSYSAVRVVHLALYADASRRGSADRGAITGMAATTILGLVLLVAGGFLSPGPRAALWTLAALIDYAGPTWFTRHRLRSLQAVAVEHFSERYGLFLIICLGESLVAVLATSAPPDDVPLVVDPAAPRFRAKRLARAAFDRVQSDRLFDLAIGNPVFAALAKLVFFHRRGLASTAAWRDLLR